MDNDHGFSKASPNGNHMIDCGFPPEPKKCKHCEGSGAEPGTPEDCTFCGGSGYAHQVNKIL